MSFWRKAIRKETNETAENKEKTTKKANRNKFILECAIVLLAILGLALLYLPIIGGTTGLVILVKLIREKNQNHWALALLDKIVGKEKDD